MTRSTGRSLRVLEPGGRPEWVEGPLDPDTSPGSVLVRVGHSSLNYKDALAATGRAPVLRRHPLTLGIDAAGVVVESGDPAVPPGTRVVVTGFGMSEDHDGGWADWLRVPADWVVPVPEGLTGEEAMALGTAGLTAPLAIHRLAEHGLRPGDGPVAVTGASGGSGMLAVAMLARLGHEVVALTGRPGSRDLLGVNTGWFDPGLRRRLWQRMATDLRPADLAAVYRTEPLTAVTTLVEDLLEGRVTGRVVLAV